MLEFYPRRNADTKSVLVVVYFKWNNNFYLQKQNVFFVQMWDIIVLVKTYLSFGF